MPKAYMKTALMGMVLLLTTFGAESPKLSEAQIKQYREIAQNKAVADLSAEIGRLKQEVAGLQAALWKAQACDANGLRVSECEIKDDGTITKKPTPKPEPQK